MESSNWISPIAFSLGPINIYWYGIGYLLTFVLSFIIWSKYLYTPFIKWQLDTVDNPTEHKKSFLDNFLTFVVLGVILGGRLGYVLFYNLSEYLSNPIAILKLWEGGMSFHGGIIGLIIGMIIFARRNRVLFLSLTDMLCLVAPIGIFFGRVSNFINIELVGRTTTSPLGIVFPGDTVARHPSQLYQAGLEGILLGIIMFFTFKLAIKNYSSRVGILSLFFLFFYGLFRFIVEFFREPDIQLGFIFLGLSMGQLLSLGIVFLIVILLYMRHSYSHKNT
ncbi:MAG: prolipoprotein diacylglyceryl transferase [Alphaproteobacteria bacterium]|nr:prolipoprotein diacylglyceryl transferase [Alphaproteobacteria bacterium]MBL0717688.1 prolipoprotein diacylglyceryl transferase [Alphaproteobacteria bacterium]